MNINKVIYSKSIIVINISVASHDELFEGLLFIINTLIIQLILKWFHLCGKELGC